MQIYLISTSSGIEALAHHETCRHFTKSEHGESNICIYYFVPQVVDVTMNEKGKSDHKGRQHLARFHFCVGPKLSRGRVITEIV